MPFTQAQVDALKAAIATGTKRVQYDNRLVEYQSIADMLKALGVMEAELAAGTGTTRFAEFSRD